MNACVRSTDWSRRAKSLLAAWREADTGSLKAQVQRGPGRLSAPSLVDLEYQEVLDSIVAKLQRSLRPSLSEREMNELRVSYLLLRHLSHSNGSRVELSEEQ
jgi:hypothetical protein